MNFREQINEKRKKELLKKLSDAMANFYRKNKKRIISLSIAAVIIALIVMSFFAIDSYLQSKELPKYALVPKNLNSRYLTDEMFIKIIGAGGYDIKILASDTLKIKEKLEKDDRIFGTVTFKKSIIPPFKIEVLFREAEPLFVQQISSANPVKITYSNKGRPYTLKKIMTPVVDVKDSSGLFVATNFLTAMQNYDLFIYSSTSQVTITPKNITVFFNDVPFKTIFSTDPQSWNSAFRYYKQLNNFNIENANSLNLSFSSDSLAYIE